MSVPGEFTAGDVLAASEMNSLPGGVLGYAEATSSQVSITTEADLTGLSVTVTAAASRRIKITAVVRISVDAADVRTAVRIKESTTTLQSSTMSHPIAGVTGTMMHTPAVVLTPSSGSHTYKLSAEAVDSGTASTSHSSTVPAFILVEDIGAV